MISERNDLMVDVSGKPYPERRPWSPIVVPQAQIWARSNGWPTSRSRPTAGVLR